MEKIRNIILNNIHDFNKSQGSMCIELLNNNNVERKYKRFGLDYRIEDDDYKDSMIVFSFLDKETKEVLALGTMIIFNKEQYSNIEFWSHNENEKLLRKVSLKDLMLKHDNYAMTLGFTKISNDFRIKYRFTKFYTQLIDDILRNIDIFVFAECTGIKSFDAEALEDIDVIYEAENLFDKESLGAIRADGVVARKFIELVNFKEVKNIYNLYTLGQIFFYYIESNKELTL